MDGFAPCLYSYGLVGDRTQSVRRSSPLAEIVPSPFKLRRLRATTYPLQGPGGGPSYLSSPRTPVGYAPGLSALLNMIESFLRLVLSICHGIFKAFLLTNLEKPS
jgi:hypothetical protein